MGNQATLCVNQYRTESGKLCQKWNQSTPHKPKSHIVENVKKITGYTDHNQCVRAYSGSSRSWCYTTDSKTRWENCACIEESPNCKDVSTTIKGHKCQKWTSSSPHEPNRWMVAFLRSKEYEIPNHNFCRVADRSDPKPWCYTTDPDVRFDYCDIDARCDKCGTVTQDLGYKYDIFDDKAEVISSVSPTAAISLDKIFGGRQVEAGEVPWQV